MTDLVVDSGLLVGAEDNIDGLGGFDGDRRLLDDDLVADDDGLGDVTSGAFHVLEVGRFAVACKRDGTNLS